MIECYTLLNSVKVQSDVEKVILLSKLVNVYLDLKFIFIHVLHVCRLSSAINRKVEKK